MNLKEIAYSHYLPAKRKRRHTWATIAVEAGAGIEAVAMMLGHGSINTTQQYYLQPTRKICAGVQALVSERIVGALFRIPNKRQDGQNRLQRRHEHGRIPRVVQRRSVHF